MSSIGFGMKVLKYTSSSFERQILESVLIQENRNHHLLNSHSEYNRCAVPKLSSRIGDSDYKKYEQEIEKEKEKEIELVSRIRELRKERNKNREADRKQGQPATKRRKLEEGWLREGKPGTRQTKSQGEKRKDTRESEMHKQNDQNPPLAKRQKQADIRTLLKSKKEALDITMKNHPTLLPVRSRCSAHPHTQQ
jgi:hypothetical protein